MTTEKEKALEEFWQIVDPNDNGIIKSTNIFVRELQELCNLSSNATAADIRLEHYEETRGADKKIIKELEEDADRASTEFYNTFVTFVKKYNSESSRVHSAMGAKTSERKVCTSRENGKKGGRPRNPNDTRTRTH